ncbi:ROK family transcriptional regulator [Streptomyces roseicoloratus]|uniref:ROK family transcriptional regulator n=1 Tax=Streptomyces roseicoloratus TaxID=2508722 RepID=A0ABY9S0Y7_9ACTN|nr:ROK family transcriptional regulator [Streptomyces roseicoloratus]WMX48087.1 ROK family transcriptional regulator [Streptomyces roseicoloratus]
MRATNGRTVRDLRRENRTAVLRRLWFDGPMSRFSLGPATGLSSGSVSNVVAELAAEGLVEEAGSVDSAGGRPRTLLRVSPDSGCMIGVDVGETRIRIELFDLTLTELARAERPLAVDGPERNQRYDVGLVVGHIRDGIAEVLREAGADPGRLLGVGAGVPGIVAHGGPDGAVVHGQTIGWDAVPLERLLRESVDLPATVPYRIDNGARTLGQAELWFGAGRGAHSAVFVLFGSGVGACVATDPLGPGRALEWGHMTVRVRGRRCRCGALGCLEAYAGAEALLERWREAGGRPPACADEETALTALLAAAYPEPGSGREPDTTALAVLDETAEYLGAGFADLVNLFQPERILVGGWAGLRLGERFLAGVRVHARAYALRYPADRVTIGLGTLGPEAVTIGAAILPLADFFARGGRRAEAEPGPAEAQPAWTTTVRERTAH